MELLLYRRQFIIARHSVLVDDSWRQTNLPGGWILSYQQDLAVTAEQQPDEIVLGTRLCRMRQTGQGTGRYVLIRWPRVMPDAAALLSIYYGTAEGDMALASHPGLVKLALTGRIPPPDIAEPLDHRGAINFIPMPGSRWHGVRRLFHDQCVNLATARIEHNPTGVAPLHSTATARIELVAELVRFADELRRRIPGTIFLPLTAGLDSRTLAAAFLSSGVRFETVTFHYAGKSVADVRIAAAISRRWGLRHHVITLQHPLDARRGELLEEHVGGAFLDWDISHLFPGQGYRYLGPSDAKLVGSCFELGRNYYAPQFGDLDFDTATGAEVWQKRSDGTEGPAVLSAMLDDWLAWRRAHPLPGGWINAFYLDQRLSGWRAALEQGYDLLPGLALSPANNARIFAALLTGSAEEQNAQSLQHEAIFDMAPELMRFAVNPLPWEERLGRLQRKVRRLGKRVLVPLAGTVSGARAKLPH